MGRYSDSARMLAVTVGGARLRRDIVDQVQSATLDLSATQTSQLTMTIVDPTLSLLRAGLFAKRSAVEYGPLRFEIAVRETTVIGSGAAAVPGVRIVARDTVVQRLGRITGARIVRNVTASRYVALAARSVGARYLVQPTTKRAQIIRKAEKGQDPESEWKVCERLAAEHGFRLFATEGVVYFGRPSWLAQRLPRVSVHWAGVDTDKRIAGLPRLRDSENDRRSGYTGSLQASPDLAEQLRPGRVIVLTGVPTFDGTYLADSLVMDLGGSTDGAIAMSTPIDPVPTGVTDATPNHTAPVTVTAPGPVHPSGHVMPIAGTTRGDRTNGVSIYGRTGDLVRAAAGGTVLRVGAGQLTTNVVVREAGGLDVTYGHLGRASVRKGQRVTRGQTIGTRGRATSTEGYARVEFNLNGRRQVPWKYLGQGI